MVHLIVFLIVYLCLLSGLQRFYNQDFSHQITEAIDGKYDTQKIRMCFFVFRVWSLQRSAK